METSKNAAGKAPLEEMSAEEYKIDVAKTIVQMMFVSGETAEPSQETTTIIEEIVHTQVVEMVIPTSRTPSIHPSSLLSCSSKGRPY